MPRGSRLGPGELGILHQPDQQIVGNGLEVVRTPSSLHELTKAAAEGGVVFAGVMSGPLVRSSYRAGRLYRQALESRRIAQPTA